MKTHLMTGAIAFSALTLSACGGGGDAPPPPEDAPETETTTEEATPEAAVEAPAADNIETVDGTTLASFTGNAADGKAVFLKCGACHTVDEGVNRIGPSLHEVVGRTAGTVEGFTYSEANANSGITWTPEKLFQYLENPQRVIPGTKMVFAGLPNAQDRADVIAYLGDPTD